MHENCHYFYIPHTEQKSDNIRLLLAPDFLEVLISSHFLLYYKSVSRQCFAPHELVGHSGSFVGKKMVPIWKRREKSEKVLVRQHGSSSEREGKAGHAPQGRVPGGKHIEDELCNFE